jgi:hypothetical protein
VPSAAGDLVELVGVEPGDEVLEFCVDVHESVRDGWRGFDRQAAGAVPVGAENSISCSHVGGD